jgi:hypothetical protein
MAEKEAISKAPVGRVTRVPVGSRNVLTVKGKDPNYEYRIVTDKEDRVTQFLEAGYEIVADDAADVGDKRVQTASSIGSKKHISVGQGEKAFLMRIKKEWYQEDQLAKQRRVNEVESSIREKALDGTYGKLEITRD